MHILAMFLYACIVIAYATSLELMASEGAPPRQTILSLKDTVVTSMCLSADKQHLAYVAALTSEVVVLTYPDCRLVNRYRFSTRNSDADTSELPAIRKSTPLNPHNVFIMAVEPGKNGLFNVQLMIQTLHSIPEHSNASTLALGWLLAYRSFIIDPKQLEFTPSASIKPIGAYAKIGVTFSDTDVFVLKSVAHKTNAVEFVLIDTRTQSTASGYNLELDHSLPDRATWSQRSTFTGYISNNYCLLWDDWNLLPQAGTIATSGKLVMKDIQGSAVMTALRSKIESFRDFDEMDSVRFYKRYGNPAIQDIDLYDGQVVLTAAVDSGAKQNILIERYSIDKRVVVATRDIHVTKKIVWSAILHVDATHVLTALKYADKTWTAIEVEI